MGVMWSVGSAMFSMSLLSSGLVPILMGVLFKCMICMSSCCIMKIQILLCLWLRLCSVPRLRYLVILSVSLTVSLLSNILFIETKFPCAARFSMAIITSHTTDKQSLFLDNEIVVIY
jgi:hypothetical protein